MSGVMDIARLRSSFQLVVDREPLVLERFYEVLFERHPQARPLFGRNSRKAQAQMPTQALVSVPDQIEAPEWPAETPGPMGPQPGRSGVTDGMYDWVGDALLVTLAEVADDAWTPEVAADWAEAYGAIASLMKQGAARAA